MASDSGKRSDRPGVKRGGFYRLPLVVEPQPGGGFTVTSPALPELVTEGDTLAEAMENVRDALEAVLEIYADEGRSLPEGVEVSDPKAPLALDYVLIAG